MLEFFFPVDHARLGMAVLFVFFFLIRPRFKRFHHQLGMESNTIFPQASDLCPNDPAHKAFSGKFKKLSEYFEDITVQELRTDFGEEELLDSVPVHRKALMRVWVNRWNESARVAELRPMELKGEKLDLSRKCCSSCYEDLPDSTSIHRLFSILSEPENLRLLDLSECHLRDEDLKHVQHIVQECGNLQFLNLSWNGFHKEVDVLEAIAETMTARNGFVAVVGTPFASIDNQRFFSQKYVTDLPNLKGLIWIPQEWLEKQGWRNLLKDDHNGHVELPEKVTLIHTAHLKFYQTNPFSN